MRPVVSDYHALVALVSLEELTIMLFLSCVLVLSEVSAGVGMHRRTGTRSSPSSNKQWTPVEVKGVLAPRKGESLGRFFGKDARRHCIR